MPTPKTNTPTAATPTLTKVLHPRKPNNLNPGTPDLPHLQRSSAEVRAEKKRKEVEKEASATKKKAAKAQVNGLRKALHQEQVDGCQGHSTLNALSVL